MPGWFAPMAAPWMRDVWIVRPRGRAGRDTSR